jgi:hypothetical protein
MLLADLPFPSAGTIRALPARRPLALAGGAVVLLDAVLGLLGAGWGPVAALALLAGPGLAWLPVLPRGVRAERLAAVAAAPALSLGLAAVALITVARIGIPLTGASVRLVLLALVAVGLALPGTDPAGAAPRWAAAGLGLVLLVAAALAGRVIHGFPVPGNDWAHYVLYADEIRRRHALLIRNPYWMLGVPFREDPGAPSLYGAFLLMTGARAVTLAHGIWVLTLAVPAAVYAWVRSLAPPAAALLAAALVAVVPASQDILGWQGVANVLALALMPLALAYAVPLARARLAPTEIAGAALVLVAIAAAHRLSFAVTLGTLALSLPFLAWRRWPGAARNAAWVALAAIVLGLGVLLDIRARQRTFGGTLPYTDYLGTKLALGRLAKDLTYPVCAAAVAAVAWLAVRRERLGELLPAVALLVVTAAGIYAYVVHVPLAYLRMAYYVPLALAPIVGVALVRLAAARAALGLALAAVVLLAALPLSVHQGGKVRDFYTFTDAAALRGLDLLAARLRPDEVVATDRCWSFQATWLLRTRTLPALDTADIQPAAELPIAREAHAVLADTPAGRRAARRLGVRFALADPVCSDPAGRALPPPRNATVVYASPRLVVFRLRR